MTYGVDSPLSQTLEQFAECNHWLAFTQLTDSAIELGIVERSVVQAPSATRAAKNNCEVHCQEYCAIREGPASKQEMGS